MTVIKEIRALAFIIISALFLWVGMASAADSTKQVEKFSVAIQRKDFKTIFNTSYYYQMELSQIKANNPKALWQKLSTEYYESKKREFPETNIRELIALLPLSSKWKVIESKKEGDRFIVYVSITYKTPEESPLIGSKLLKQTILEFVMNAKTALYMSSGRVGKGDVYWGGDPTADLRVAQTLVRYGLWEESINILERLQNKGVINNEGKLLLARAYLERIAKRCIEKGSGGFYGFRTSWGSVDESCWRPEIKKAIALDQDIRKQWVSYLVEIMRINFKTEFLRYTDGEKDINYIAIVATQFSLGYPELERLIYEPKLDLTNMYLTLAMNANYYETYFWGEHLSHALTLSNDSLIRQKALGIIKSHLIQALFNKDGQRIIPILRIFDGWAFSVDSKDMPLFAKAATIASSRDEWGQEYERLPHWKQKAKEWYEKNPVELTDQQMEQFFTAKNWLEKGIKVHHENNDEAIRSYKNAITLDPDFAGAYYNLACIYSLQGNESTACDILSKAIEKGYKNWEHIKGDSDFDNIRNSDCYKRIMSGR